MPSLVRFLVILVILAVLCGAGIFYLANYVGPHTREIHMPVALDHLPASNP